MVLCVSGKGRASEAAFLKKMFSGKGVGKNAA